MNFFSTYDVNDLPKTNDFFYSTDLVFAYRNRFLSQWYGPPTRTIRCDPTEYSRVMVTPPVLSLDEELYVSKQGIDNFHEFDREKEAYYNQVARLMDPFRHYIKLVKKQVYPERSMTNAWLKCWSMIHTFDLIPKEGHLNVFCNAEFPGAFLLAINHYIKTKTYARYDWTANSLYPSVEDGRILGDQFQLYSKYPDHWCMDETHDGNVTTKETVMRVSERCPHTVHLYTSDIGIEMTHETFHDQEMLEAPLNLGQLVCGLKVLAPGGHLVCKTFMFFKPFSISLLYLVSQCFQEFYIHKPEPSRPGNSEVYLIGKHYLLREDIITQLETKLFLWTPADVHQYMTLIPESFYLDVLFASYSIYTQQMKYMEEMIHTVRALHQSGASADYHKVKYTRLFSIEQSRFREWKRLYHVPYLAREHSL